MPFHAPHPTLSVSDGPGILQRMAQSFWPPLSRYFVDSGNIVSSLFFSRLVVLEYFKPERTAVDFSLCVKVPSQQSTGLDWRRSLILRPYHIKLSSSQKIRIK